MSDGGDGRDMRDPKQLGEQLIALKKTTRAHLHRDPKMSEVYDYGVKMGYL